VAHSPCLSRDSRHSYSVGLLIRLSSHDCSCPLAARKSFDILALYKSDYYKQNREKLFVATTKHLRATFGQFFADFQRIFQLNLCAILVQNFSFFSPRFSSGTDECTSSQATVLHQTVPKLHSQFTIRWQLKADVIHSDRWMRLLLSTSGI